MSKPTPAKADWKNRIIQASFEAFKSVSLDLKVEYNKTREQKLNQISQWYSSERLVMVLGAGVSASYSLPDLLKEIRLSG